MSAADCTRRVQARTLGPCCFEGVSDVHCGALWYRPVYDTRLFGHVCGWPLWPPGRHEPAMSRRLRCEAGSICDRSCCGGGLRCTVPCRSIRPRGLARLALLRRLPGGSVVCGRVGCVQGLSRRHIRQLKSTTDAGVFRTLPCGAFLRRRSYEVPGREGSSEGGRSQGEAGGSRGQSQKGTHGK